jgi:hypothetical protein
LPVVEREHEEGAQLLVPDRDRALLGEVAGLASAVALGGVGERGEGVLGQEPARFSVYALSV